MRASGLPGRLLRREVSGGAEHCLRPGAAGRVLQPSDAEVEQLDLAAGKNDVRRLDVTVDESGGMRHLQALADGGRDGDRVVRGKRTRIVEDVPQGSARGEFHHDERRRPVDAAVEDRHQARVAERRDVPRLALEPRAEGRICRVLRAEHLDRDLAAEHLIPGPPDRRHSAGAEHVEERVPASEQASACHRRGPSVPAPLGEPAVILTGDS